MPDDLTNSAAQFPVRLQELIQDALAACNRIRFALAAEQRLADGDVNLSRRSYRSHRTQFSKTQNMNSQFCNLVVATILVSILGCSGSNTSQQSASNMTTNVSTNMQPASSRTVKVDHPNESGFAKISIRDGDIYQEGIVDANGDEVVQASSKMLVNEITGSLALVRFESKSMFVTLDGGYVSAAHLDSVNGFQYAEPFRCGLARVIVDDVEFYLDSNFDKAFGLEFEFAESFHQDRAYVKAGDRHRIIDTLGKTVADLNYDQVSPQSPWCWQVTKIENEKYLSGFVDLNGNLTTEVVYDSVGYYDPDVKRIRVGRNNLLGFLDEHARVVIPVQYEYAEPFDKSIAKVSLRGRAFFINPDGIEVRE